MELNTENRRRTYKSYKNTFPAKASRNVFRKERRQNKQQFAFNPTLRVRGVSIRNLNRHPNISRKRTDAEIVSRRSINHITPQVYPSVRLNPKLAKIFANVSADYNNGDDMLNDIDTRNNLNVSEKNRLATKVVELYGPDKNEINNNNIHLMSNWK